MIKCCYQFRILCCNPALNKARLIASPCFTPGMVSNTKLLLRIVHIFSWLTSPTRKIECMCPELSVLPRLEQCVFPYTFFVVVNQSWHTTHRIPEPRFCHKHFRKPPLRAIAIRNAPNDSLANLPTKNVSNFWRNTTYYCGLSWFFSHKHQSHMKHRTCLPISIIHFSSVGADVPPKQNIKDTVKQILGWDQCCPLQNMKLYKVTRQHLNARKLTCLAKSKKKRNYWKENKKSTLKQ